MVSHNMCVILDIESFNHLKKDCDDDPSKLIIGLVGIKYLGKEKFDFFEKENLNELEVILSNANLIIGYNLVGHNGLDYKMLQNYGFNTKKLLSKTYDIMTVLIRTFGSFKGMSLDNILKSTFDISKKKSKKANYKLIQSGQIDKVKKNLKHELTMIEKLFLRITSGSSINFMTSWHLLDEHELPFYNGFPIENEEIVEPLDVPIAGMRLQIKDTFNDIVFCKSCNKSWKVKSICYYGDTMSQKIYCPHCNNYLIEVRTNIFGEEIGIIENTVTM